ncbi:MAG: hypothetical protein WCD21_08340 [Streptomyces sp.]
MLNTKLPRLIVPLLLCTVSLSACGNESGRDDSRSGNHAEAAAPKAQGSLSFRNRSSAIPQLGQRMQRSVERLGAKQVVLVSGDAPDSSYATVHLYERGVKGEWRRAFEPWPARNGQRGWTTQHTAGDLSSPVGVFGLSDAGGLLPDPGSKLPYDQSPVYEEDGVGSLGQSLRGAFDHVVAINYNRNPGTPPRNLVRPMGSDRGGGIFIHIEHGGPTQACVALPRKKMSDLLKWLDPRMHPVIAMGDIESVSR